MAASSSGWGRLIGVNGWQLETEAVVGRYGFMFGSWKQRVGWADMGVFVWQMKAKGVEWADMSVWMALGGLKWSN